MGQRLSDCYKKKVIAIQPAKHHKFLFGSPSSTRWTLHEHLLFQRRLCRQGVAVMSKQKLRVKVLMCLDPRFFIFCTLVRPFIKPLRISNMMSCSQDTLSDFPISCNLAGNRVLAHGTMHLVHCFKSTIP